MHPSVNRRPSPLVEGLTKGNVKHVTRANRSSILPIPGIPVVIREGVGMFCIKCGSTASKKGFLRLLGERTCDNDRCENSEKKFKKL